MTDIESRRGDERGNSDNALAAEDSAEEAASERAQALASTPTTAPPSTATWTACAVTMIREGKGELLMKGSLHTDELMREVTASATGEGGRDLRRRVARAPKHLENEPQRGERDHEQHDSTYTPKRFDRAARRL